MIDMSGSLSLGKDWARTGEEKEPLHFLRDISTPVLLPPKMFSM